MIYEMRVSFGYLPNDYRKIHDYEVRDVTWLSASTYNLFMIGLLGRLVALVVFVVRNYTIADVKNLAARKLYGAQSVPYRAASAMVQLGSGSSTKQIARPPSQLRLPARAAAAVGSMKNLVLAASSTGASRGFTRRHKTRSMPTPASLPAPTTHMHAKRKADEGTMGGAPLQV